MASILRWRRKYDPRFNRVKINGAALVPGGFATPGTGWCRRFRSFTRFRRHILMTTLLQHLAHLGVGQACMGVNHRLIKLYRQ